MKISQMIKESDTLIPNAYSESDKVSWLNHINQEFFNVVKIPKLAIFSSVKGQSEYNLSKDVRSKNIDLVQIGLSKYEEFEGNPTHNWFVFDDVSRKLTVYPAPYEDGQQGIVKYFQIGTTSFMSTNLSAEPDAPSEYHYIYVLGLCERIAKAMEDVDLANKYATDYQNALTVAVQNYQKEETV